MTREQFIKTLYRLDKTSKTNLEKAKMDLPRAAEQVAITCFINECGGVDDTIELIRQLKHLRQYGIFDFDS